MGYPMTWNRLVFRNRLEGNYRPLIDGKSDPIGLISGDMRRLETDTMDDLHLNAYAKLSGCTPEQVKIIFAEFFEKESIKRKIQLFG